MGEPLARHLREGISDREIAVEVARFLDSKRAEDIVILDVGELLPITSYFVLATGTSSRALRAIAADLDRLLRSSTLCKIGIEYDNETRWVCLDYSDIVVHLFDREARGFYDLENLWADAPRVESGPE